MSELTGLELATFENDDMDLPEEVVLTPPDPKPVKSTPTDDDRQQAAWRQNLSDQVVRIGTQGEFAELTGLETGQLSKFLTGSKRITLRTMFRVAAITGNYEWYTAPPADHEGQRLRDYLEYNGYEQQWLADQMSQAKSSVSSLLAQVEIKRSKWNEIETALGASKATILSDLLPNAKNSNINEQHNNINNALRHKRVRSAAALMTQYVTIRSIPATTRVGFNYQKMVNQLPKKQVPLSQLHRINAQLTPEQIQEQIERYDVIEIAGNDHMEPGLRAGQEILAYRLYSDSERIDYPVGRWSEESGPMAVGTTNGRVYIGRVLENLLSTKQLLTLVKDDPRGGSATFQLEQIVNIWKLETYVGGPVV